MTDTDAINALSMRELRDVARGLHVGTEGNHAQIVNRIIEALTPTLNPAESSASVWATSAGLPSHGKRR